MTTPAAAPPTTEPTPAPEPADLRTEANRRNASKSTGPRTPEGKARSRRNALRHGLAAETLVSETERQAVVEAIAEWNHEVWPENVAERAIIRRMAVADVRLKRCENAAEENLEATARAAVDRWRARKQNAARKKACALKSDPINTLLDLEDSAFGCDWLIRRWTGLDRLLEQGIGWSDADRQAAMLLIGYFPVAPGPDSSTEARQMWHLGRLASGLPAEDEGPARDPSPPADPAAARSALRTLIAERIDALEARAADCWHRAEGPERAAVIARSLAGDDGPESQLRHRYDRDSQNALLRSITMLIRIRKRRDELDEKHRKLSKEHHIERLNAGGGWWREPTANACPPGYQPISRGPAADPATDPSSRATDVRPEAVRHAARAAEGDRPPSTTAPSSPDAPANTSGATGGLPASAPDRGSSRADKPQATPEIRGDTCAHSAPDAPTPPPSAPQRNEPKFDDERPADLERNPFDGRRIQKTSFGAPPRRPERSRNRMAPLADPPTRTVGADGECP